MTESDRMKCDIPGLVKGDPKLTYPDDKTRQKVNSEVSPPTYLPSTQFHFIALFFSWLYNTDFPISVGYAFVYICMRIYIYVCETNETGETQRGREGEKGDGGSRRWD